MPWTDIRSNVNIFYNYLYTKTNFIIEVKTTVIEFISNPFSIVGNGLGIFLGFIQENPKLSLLTTATFLAISVILRLQKLYLNWREHEAKLNRDQIKLEASLEKEKELHNLRLDLLKDNHLNQEKREDELHNKLLKNDNRTIQRNIKK